MDFHFGVLPAGWELIGCNKAVMAVGADARLAHDLWPGREGGQAGGASPRACVPPFVCGPTSHPGSSLAGLCPCAPVGSSGPSCARLASPEEAPPGQPGEPFSLCHKERCPGPPAERSGACERMPIPGTKILRAGTFQSAGAGCSHAFSDSPRPWMGREPVGKVSCLSGAPPAISEGPTLQGTMCLRGLALDAAITPPPGQRAFVLRVCCWAPRGWVTQLLLICFRPDPLSSAPLCPPPGHGQLGGQAQLPGG